MIVSSHSKLYLRALVCVLIGAVLWLWYPVVSPSASPVTVTHMGSTERAELPFRTESVSQARYALSFRMSHSAASATRYNLWADDCLEHVVVNGVSLSRYPLPLCDWGKSFEFDLSSVLKDGQNDFTIIISNHPGNGGFHLAPSFFDSRVLSFRITTCVFILWLTWIATGGLIRYPLTRASLLLGVFLRLFYFYVTPARVRSHDFEGHLEFIYFIATHLQLPPASQGWEFHQPPLYYLFTGGVLHLLQSVGSSASEVLSYLQLFSLVCAICTLFVGVKIGEIVFGERSRELPLLAYSLILSTLPSLVFSSTRVSNDVLFHLFAFTWMLAIVRWWYKPTRLAWLPVLALLMLLCVTKATAAPLIASTLVLSLLRPQVSRSHRILAFTSGALVSALTVGSLWLYRSAVEAAPSLFDKGQTLHSALRVGNGLANFLHFNLRDVLITPFNNPWGDEAGRQHFWEFLFRSIFFGEFQYAPEIEGLASCILLFGFLWIVFALWGFACAGTAKEFSFVPLAVVGLSLLGALITFRVWYPFAVHQDFRFIHLLGVPLAAFPSMCRPPSRALTIGLATLTGTLALLLILFLLLLLDNFAPL